MQVNLRHIIGDEDRSYTAIENMILQTVHGIVNTRNHIIIMVDWQYLRLCWRIEHQLSSRMLPNVQLNQCSIQFQLTFHQHERKKHDHRTASPLAFQCSPLMLQVLDYICPYSWLCMSYLERVVMGTKARPGHAILSIRSCSSTGSVLTLTVSRGLDSVS